MFRNRTEAGEQLAQKLEAYQHIDAVVFALPRGGVKTALPVAKKLKAPLDLIIARKIGHPTSPEYAIAAIAEDGHIVGNEAELVVIDRHWLESEKQKQKDEARRRRELYLKDIPPVSVEDKVAIIVDDGVATGLTMRLAIIELKHRKPRRIIVAVPVISEEAAAIIKNEVDELIVLEPPEAFLDAVGAHYAAFAQVEDEEVTALLNAYHAEYTAAANS